MSKTVNLNIPETAQERVAIQEANRECQCPKCGRLHRRLANNPPASISGDMGEDRMSDIVRRGRRWPPETDIEECIAEIERLRAQILLQMSDTELEAETESLRLQCSQWEITVNQKDAEIERLQMELSACGLDCEAYFNCSEELAAEVERLRVCKTPASAQLLNITKAALDHAEASNAELVEALREIADEHPHPGMAEGLQEIARAAIAKTEKAI